MSATDIMLVTATVLCALGFTALVVVLMRVLDTVNLLRDEVRVLRSETGPLLDELRYTTEQARTTMDTARSDLDRFDRVLGSAEAVSDAVNDSGRAARRLFSAPVIKAAGVAAGTRRAAQRLRGQTQRVQLVIDTHDIDTQDDDTQHDDTQHDDTQHLDTRGVDRRDAVGLELRANGAAPRRNEPA